MHTGMLIEDLFAAVKRAEESAGKALREEPDSGVPEAASKKEEEEKLRARKVPAAAWSEPG